MSEASSPAMENIGFMAYNVLAGGTRQTRTLTLTPTLTLTLTLTLNQSSPHNPDPDPLTRTQGG